MLSSLLQRGITANNLQDPQADLHIQLSFCQYGPLRKACIVASDLLLCLTSVQSSYRLANRFSEAFNRSCTAKVLSGHKFLMRSGMDPQFSWRSNSFDLLQPNCSDIRGSRTVPNDCRRIVYSSVSCRGAFLSCTCRPPVLLR